MACIVWRDFGCSWAGEKVVTKRIEVGFVGVVVVGVGIVFVGEGLYIF